MIDPYVLEWVAGTNGRLYIPLINNLPRYPIPNWAASAAEGQLLLDIGTGWGRWMVSAAGRGYIPVGIDIKLDALRAAKRVLHEHGIPGYVVAAELDNLPFKRNIFHTVFSYSVIQHVHRQRAERGIQEVHRILIEGGSCILQFPTECGLGNLLRKKSRDREAEGDYSSWCVRYYAIGHLKEFFLGLFGNFEYKPDCYLGIGVQSTDIDILPWRYKIVVILSEVLKNLSRFIPILKKAADSIFVFSYKAGV